MQALKYIESSDPIVGQRRPAETFDRCCPEDFKALCLTQSEALAIAARDAGYVAAPISIMHFKGCGPMEACLHGLIMKMLFNQGKTVCQMSMAYMAKQLNVSESTVRRSMAKLKKARVIGTKAMRGRGGSYWIGILREQEDG